MIYTIALVVAFLGLMVLGFLATGLLMPRATARERNIVTAAAFVALLLPAFVAMLGAL